MELSEQKQHARSWQGAAKEHAERATDWSELNLDGHVLFSSSCGPKRIHLYQKCSLQDFCRGIILVLYPYSPRVESYIWSRKSSVSRYYHTTCIQPKPTVLVKSQFQQRPHRSFYYLVHAANMSSLGHAVVPRL